MIEILLLALVAVGLAKRKGRRRRFNLRRVRITPELPLLTLASDTVLFVSAFAGATAQLRVVTMKTTWALTGLTAGEGPITVGYCHSDYTVGEIKECLEAATAVNPGDKIANEQSNRLVRVVGVFSEHRNTLNNGNPIKTKLNWLMGGGSTNVVRIFAYNENTAAMTTGSILNVQGDMWVKDST